MSQKSLSFPRSPVVTSARPPSLSAPCSLPCPPVLGYSFLWFVSDLLSCASLHRGADTERASLLLAACPEPLVFWHLLGFPSFVVDAVHEVVISLSSRSVSTRFKSSHYCLCLFSIGSLYRVAFFPLNVMWITFSCCINQKHFKLKSSVC